MILQSQPSKHLRIRTILWIRTSTSTKIGTKIIFQIQEIILGHNYFSSIMGNNMLFHINIVGWLSGWWIDIGVSRHIKYHHSIFKTYTFKMGKCCWEILTPIRLLTLEMWSYNSQYKKNLKDVMHSIKNRKQLNFWISIEQCWAYTNSRGTLCPWWHV